MKKVLSFLFAALAISLVACGGGASSPGAAAKKYAEYVAAGNYDKFIDGIYYGENASDSEIEQNKAMLKSLLTDKVAKDYEAKGGLKTVDVISEEISEDGQTADVDLKYTYGNGETSDEDVDMVLVDGKWMMELNK